MDFDKKRKSLDNQIQDLNLRLTKLRDVMKPPDLFKFDNPKGKIVLLDPKGEIAFVDVGSPDNIKPHQSLTFASFGAAAGVNAGGGKNGRMVILGVHGAHAGKGPATQRTR